MRSHSVTCHQAKVTFLPLPQPKMVLDLVTPEGCQAEVIYLAGYISSWHGIPTPRRSPIQVLTGLDVRSYDERRWPPRHAAITLCIATPCRHLTKTSRYEDYLPVDWQAYQNCWPCHVACLTAQMQHFLQHRHEPPPVHKQVSEKCRYNTGMSEHFIKVSAIENWDTEQNQVVVRPTIYTHIHHHLTCLCPGLPGCTGTRRNIHALTPTVHFHNLSPGPLRSSSWPSTSYSIHFFTKSLPYFHNTWPYHDHTTAACFATILKLCYLFLISLSAPYMEICLLP